MFKKISALVLALTLVFVTILPIHSYAAGVNVIINGTGVIYTQSSGAPFVDSANRTQVPLRETMEQFGATVFWDSSSRTALVEKGGINVKVPVGASYIIKDDQVIQNDTAAVIRDNRTYLPIRAVLEAFGANVTWDGNTKTIEVNDGPVVTNADIVYYDDHYGVPDFGEVAGCAVDFENTFSSGAKSYFYDLDNFDSEAYELYGEVLQADGYTLMDYNATDPTTKTRVLFYEKSSIDKRIVLSKTVLGNFGEGVLVIIDNTSVKIQ